MSAAVIEAIALPFVLLAWTMGTMLLLLAVWGCAIGLLSAVAWLVGIL